MLPNGRLHLERAVVSQAMNEIMVKSLPGTQLRTSSSLLGNATGGTKYGYLHAQQSLTRHRPACFNLETGSSPKQSSINPVTNTEGMPRIS